MESPNKSVSYPAFNLERALAGDKVLLQRQDGATDAVSELAHLPKCQLIAAKCNGSILATFNESGARLGGWDGDRLVMAPKTRSVTVWVNGYMSENGVYLRKYDSEEEADRRANLPERLGKAQPVTFTWDEV